MSTDTNNTTLNQYKILDYPGLNPLIKNIDFNNETNKAIITYMDKIFQKYNTPDIQSSLIKIFQLLLHEKMVIGDRAKIFKELQKSIETIYKSNTEKYISDKLKVISFFMSDSKTIDAILVKLQEFNKCDDESLEDLCKKTLRLLPPSDPTLITKMKDIITSRFNKPLTKQAIIEEQKNAVTYATRAYNWSKRNISMRELKAIEDQRSYIEGIKITLEAELKKCKEEMDNDSSLYNVKQPIYEQLLVSM